jgi:hypothetical protein
MVIETVFGIPTAIFGAAVSVLGAVSALFITIVANRSLEGKKATLLKDVEVKKTDLLKDVEQKKSELAAQTEMLKADLLKDAETHKLNLRKTEILFGKEIEAAAAFIKLRKAISPKVSWPGMESEHAAEDLARRFDKVEELLETYIVEHGAVLNADFRKELYDFASVATNYKFAHAIEEHEQEIAEANKRAWEMFVGLIALEDKMIAELRKNTLST